MDVTSVTHGRTDRTNVKVSIETDPLLYFFFSVNVTTLRGEPERVLVR